MNAPQYPAPRHALAPVCIGLSLLLAAGSAVAGAGEITPTVTTPAPVVSYKTTTPPLTTHIAYQVAVGNSGGNTINDIVFVGTISRPRGTAQPVLVEPIEGAACTSASTATHTTVTCRLGQLSAGSAVPTFSLFFAAPEQGTVDLAAPSTCAEGIDCVRFSGTVRYAEGLGGPRSKPKNSIVAWSAGDVALGTPAASDVRSVVLKNGNTVATGAGSGVSTADAFATSVVVPPAPAATTATVFERALGPTDGDCNFLRVCYESTITIADFGGNTQLFGSALQITLLVHGSNVKGGPGTIKQVSISYDGAIVGECASGPVPNSDYTPCIASRGVDAEGNFRWTLLNLKNGSYKVF